MLAPDDLLRSQQRTRTPSVSDKRFPQLESSVRRGRVVLRRPQEARQTQNRPSHTAPYRRVGLLLGGVIGGFTMKCAVRLCRGPSRSSRSLAVTPPGPPPSLICTSSNVPSPQRLPPMTPQQPAAIPPLWRLIGADRYLLSAVFCVETAALPPRRTRGGAGGCYAGAESSNTERSEAARCDGRGRAGDLEGGGLSEDSETNSQRDKGL